jgi:hypothetical protein
MLLISQVQRAGGTLLSRLFDGHPECFAHPMELKWGRPAKWNWPSFAADAAMRDREAFDLLDEVWVRKALRHGGYGKYAQSAPVNGTRHRPRYPFAFDRGLAQEVFADAYRHRRPGVRRDALDAYLTAFFNAWLDYQNLYATPKRWVTAFVPRLAMHADSLERFFEDYPDGMLVTIVRDPRTWFASASRHTFPSDPAESLRHWTASTQSSLSAAERYGDRVIVVLFEDLVLRTRAVMQGICSRTGLTFSESMLQPTYNGMPVLSDSSFRESTSIDPEVTRRAALLTSAEAAEIDRLAAGRYLELASRYGVSSAV